MPTAALERLLPRRAQPVIAVAVALGLLAMAGWYVVSGGPEGALVDHDRPPSLPIRHVVHLDRATEPELALLPGIGPALARRIVDRRDSAGPFRSAEDLLAVPGIGAATLERLRPHLAPLPEDGAPPHPIGGGE